MLCLTTTCNDPWGGSNVDCLLLEQFVIPRQLVHSNCLIVKLLSMDISRRHLEKVDSSSCHPPQLPLHSLLTILILILGSSQGIQIIGQHHTPTATCRLLIPPPLSDLQQQLIRRLAQVNRLHGRKE